MCLRLLPRIALTALLALLAGCGGYDDGYGHHHDGDFPGSPENPIFLSVGAGNPISVPANDYLYYAFTASVASNYTISLTNTHSDLGWELTTTSYPNIGSDQICDQVFGTGDESCVTPSLHAGVIYTLIVGELIGDSTTATVTIASGASPTALTVNGGAASAVIGEQGYAHFQFTTGAASTHTITLANVDTKLSWYLFTFPDYGATPVASCSTAISGGMLSCQTSSTLVAGTTYYLLVSNADQTFLDAPPGGFTVQVATP